MPLEGLALLELRLVVRRRGGGAASSVPHSFLGPLQLLGPLLGRWPLLFAGAPPPSAELRFPGLLCPCFRVGSLYATEALGWEAPKVGWQARDSGAGPLLVRPGRAAVVCALSRPLGAVQGSHSVGDTTEPRAVAGPGTVRVLCGFSKVPHPSPPARASVLSGRSGRSLARAGATAA